LGAVHLRVYRELPEIKALCIADSDQEKLAAYPDLPAVNDYRALLGKVDLVSVAAPTTAHFEITKFFLEHKVPVLVEKPITVNTAQADKLIALAKKHKTQLLVGHVERFNSAYLAVKDSIQNPLFIECTRISPYPNRSLDISVVLDLMIHDLDIISHLARSRVKRMEAMGVKVLSPSEDIANVRLTFHNGCVANITASRISLKRERKIRIFMHNCYISLDYAQQLAAVYRKTGNEIIHDIPDIPKEESLKKEIRHFVEMVKHKKFSLEDTVRAKDALNLALKIQDKIRRR